jgi:hypothetical protein
MIIEFMEKKSRYDEFEKEYMDSKAYLRRAKLFRDRGMAHGDVFNVASLALERYLVALCYLHDVEPFNHNYNCLMDSVEKLVNVPLELNTEIRSLDEIFDICSLDDYYHGEPEVSDMERIIAMCDGVEGLFGKDKIEEVREKAKEN